MTLFAHCPIWRPSLEQNERTESFLQSSLLLEPVLSHTFRPAGAYLQYLAAYFSSSWSESASTGDSKPVVIITHYTFPSDKSHAVQMGRRMPTSRSREALLQLRPRPGNGPKGGLGWGRQEMHGLLRRVPRHRGSACTASLRPCHWGALLDEEH